MKTVPMIRETISTRSRNEMISITRRVQQAVNDSDLSTRFPDVDFGALTCGIWGRAVMPDQVLQQGDRIELCRPLQVDPKVARRERFARQGARGTGLFAKRRSGGKPGY